MYFQTTISVYILFITIAFRKKTHGNGFFSTSSLDIIVFANFVETTAQISLPQAQNRKVQQKRNSSKYLSAFLQAIRHQSRHPG
jgi:Mg2+ and Co2+ transporter CorA